MPMYVGSAEFAPEGYKAAYVGTTQVYSAFSGIRVGNQISTMPSVGGNFQRFPVSIAAGTYVLELGGDSEQRVTWVRNNGIVTFPNGDRVDFFISGTLVFFRNSSGATGKSLTIYAQG